MYYQPSSRGYGTEIGLTSELKGSHIMLQEIRKEDDFVSDWMSQPGSVDWFRSSFPADIEEMGSPEGFTEQYYPLSRSSALLKEARASLDGLDNSDLVTQATRFLADLQKILDIFELFRGDLRDLPPLVAFMVDDGSILFEWDFRDYRFGFSIEPDPQESSWYLVTRKSMGNINASGMIYGVNLKRLLAWLTGFIVLRVEP